MRSMIFVGTVLAAFSAWSFNFSAIVPTPGAHPATVVERHPSAASGEIIEHTVQQKETAWFLSTVFYGSGNDYQRILKTNGLKKPEQVKEGMILKIENPIYLKTQANFAERYTDLWEKRAIALEKRKAGGEGQDNERQPANAEMSRESVIPVHKIRSKDSVSELPFTHMINQGVSPADLARDELNRGKTHKTNPEPGH